MAWTELGKSAGGHYSRVIGSASGTTGDTAITITHGLGVTPNFVIMASNVAGLETYTANATSVTITVGTNQNPKRVSWIIAP